MADAQLTLQEAAAALGVHYMTVYRYVRLGVLEATKSGGSWRVRASDLEALRFQQDDDAVNSRPARHGGRARVEWSERMTSRLVAGDAAGAWSVVEAGLAGGLVPEQIYLEVVSPALVTIGRLWEEGELDVGIEHRASVITLRLIGRLGPRFVRRGRARGTVVLGAPAGELHAIPVAMVADLVRAEGWEVSDLGADVPVASFVHVVRTTPGVVAVGVSVTNHAVLDVVRATLAALRHTSPGVLLVAGGAGLDRLEGESLAALGADSIVANGREFTVLLDALANRTGVRLA